MPLLYFEDRAVLKDFEVAAGAGYDIFAGEFANFGGEAAAVDFEVIGQFLAGIGDVKFAGVMLFCLGGEIGHEFFAGCASGGDFVFLVEDEIFGGNHAQEVEDYLAVEGAGAGAGAGYAAGVYHEGCAVFGGDDVHGHGGHAGAGKAFSEELGRLDGGHDGAVSVEVHADYLGASGEDDAKDAGRVAF